MNLLFQRARTHFFVALSLGLALRLWFVIAYPLVDGDTFIYGEIAKNWFWHGIIGLADEGVIRPTIIRLPGYPLFLGACFRLFGREHYHAVMFVQTGLDLIACALIAAFAARYISLRAGVIALYLAALCPFTANYVATPLAEQLSIFCIALALYAFARTLEQPAPHIWFFLLAFAISYAALLRPDGALLGVVLLPALFWLSRKQLTTFRAARLALLCAALTLLPFFAWTIRNARTFHRFEPLVPRSATDAGEWIPTGWPLWLKTWSAEFATTSEISWNVSGEPISFQDFPSRAFDSPAEAAQVAALTDAYNETQTLTPELDAQFGLLARQRIARHPLRFYLEMPAMRMADMWLRPRTEMLWIQIRWWQYQRHKAETIFAWSYAALNLAYLLAAVWGTTKRVPYMSLMLLYILLRCALLWTLDSPEQRYTIEFFPIIFILAAAAFSKRDSDAAATYLP